MEELQKLAPGNPLSLRSSSQRGNMFRDLGPLTGSRVIATDGEIGKVTDFLFDDQSWTIGYLVVDVRNWLIRPDVVLAVAAVKEPDWSKKIFRIQLTREQVCDSPVVDSAEPVSCQQEIDNGRVFRPARLLGGSTGRSVFHPDRHRVPAALKRKPASSQCLALDWL